MCRLSLPTVLTIVVVLLCRIVTASAADGPETNLIKNGDFESAVGNFPKWHGADRRFENDGCLYCGPTDEQAFRGKRSCKIRTTGTRGDCLRYVCPDMKPGKAYRFEFHYRIQSGGIVISQDGGLSQNFRLAGPTNKWKKFAVNFVAENRNYVVTIGNFRRRKPNLIFVDDVKLIALGQLPPGFSPTPFQLATLPTRAGRPAGHTALLAHFDAVVGLDVRYLQNIQSPKISPRSPLLRPNADYARGNRLSAGRDTAIVANGKFGKSVALTAPRACVIFGGEKNCPTRTATIELFAKSQSGRNIWSDGKERWFAHLHRSQMNDVTGHDGFHLDFYKNRLNQLVLSCGKGRRIQIDVAGLAPEAWHHLLLGWDLSTHRMFLSINGKGLSVSLPLPLSPGEFSTILLGNHPRQNLPAGCLLDELSITSRPPTSRSADNGPPRPMRQPRQHREFQSVLVGKGLGDIGVDEKMLLRTERRVRLWLDWVIRAQRGGGWATTVDNVRWPSMLRGGYERLCDPSGQVTFGKTYNTSHTAMHLCFAYEAIGDPRYLQAARRTADMYLELQATAPSKRFGITGRWPKIAYVTSDGTIPGHGLDRTMIQDFYITGPTLTLLYVHKLTGRKEYLEGAIRGANFLLLAQNPNGSWPHHFEWSVQAGFGTGSPNRPGGNQLRHGAELNDNATTDAIRTLVALWHWTRDDRYLAAVRRAADWVIEAQLDGPTFGWAAQYDSNNVPCWARAHEPPAAVWGNGALMASNALLLAHRLTGEEKYLVPLDRYLAALDTLRTPKGWYQQYDYKNGRPIAARGGKIYFLDDPEQLKAFQAAGGGSAGYWQRGALPVKEYNRLKQQVVSARQGKFLPMIPAAVSSRDQLIAVLKQELGNKSLNRDVDLLAARRWIPEEGLWLSTANKFDAGPAFSPCNERPVRYTLRICHLARAVIGEVDPGQVFPLGGEILRHRYHVIRQPSEFFNTSLRNR